MNVAKRTFDVCFACVGLVAASPLFVFVTLAILADDGRPIFFTQERVGRCGKTFGIFKFRTMQVNSGSRGLQLTVGADRRITRVGALLRKLKLDELPQLVNVLSGHMTFVGPRPEVPRYVAHYTASQRRILDLVPGITDPASLLYRNEGELLARVDDPERHYLEVILPDKIRISLEYAAAATIASDVQVILRTAFFVLLTLGRRRFQ